MREPLDAWLEPDEELVVASDALHPKGLAGITFYLVFALGFASGIAFGRLTGLELISFLVFLPSALFGWWFYLSRNPSGEQPAGLEPLVGLTDRRILYLGNRLRGRSGPPVEVAIPDIFSFDVSRKRSIFLPHTRLVTKDAATTIRYRIRYARSIREGLERVGAIAD